MGNASCIMRCAALLMLCLLLGCPEARNEPSAGLALPKLQDGETAVYNIVRRDTILYRSRFMVRFSEEVITSGAHPSGTVPTLGLTTTVETVGADEFFADSSLVVMRRDNLLPIRSWRELETGIGSFEVQASYAPGRVTVVKQSIDGTQTKELRLSGVTYDNEMLSFALRGLPLVPSATATFKVVIPLDMRTIAVDARVLGTKVVETPMGGIMCREVRLLVGGREIRVAYELAQPRRMVLLADPQRQTELRIVEYYPAGQPHGGKD